MFLLQVKEINVQVGDSVGEDEVILEFYPEEMNA
jgi:multidrug efflux pump subunit AcrA (membrane-fusion protein)